MDEIAKKKYCGLLMFNVPTPSFTKSKNKPGSQLTIDQTTSLENSSIRAQDKFIFTSFLEPMRVNPQRPHKNTPSKNNEPTKVSSNQEKRARRPPNSFLLYRQAIQPEITRYYGSISNAEISRILSDLWRNESNEVKLYWQNLADQKKMEYMLASSEYCNPKKVKNPKRNRKLKATDSNQFQNTQTYDNVHSHSSEYIIAMDPTIFPWYYGQFENTTPTKLPSIFPKDDSYCVINTHNDNNNAQQSLIEATTPITYPYYNNIYPY
ncbi:MATA-HMG [Gigaspora margarita]|uniref:MATA-HMG n=1 Tax=Gigaspora margarita TaxID=4874 RepID=A0A8H4B5H4_GIGMA|nr:MATA-HMG [Gigaspora margarita]